MHQGRELVRLEMWGIFAINTTLLLAVLPRGDHGPSELGTVQMHSKGV